MAALSLLGVGRDCLWRNVQSLFAEKFQIAQITMAIALAIFHWVWVGLKKTDLTRHRDEDQVHDAQVQDQSYDIDGDELCVKLVLATGTKAAEGPSAVPYETVSRRRARIQ